MNGVQRFAALYRRGWFRLLLAIALGAGAALAFPPWHVWPLLLIGFSGLLWLLQDSTGWRNSLTLGWAFGFGFFLVGVHWIGYAFLVDAERFAWMMPAAVILMAAGLALFPAAATLLACGLGSPGWPRFFALAAAWGIGEWLRGHLFGGFPWHNLGFTWSASDGLLQAASLIGIQGLGVATIAAACLPAMALRDRRFKPRRSWLAIAGGLTLFLAIWLWGQNRLDNAPRDYHEGLTLRVVQAAIPQSDKWVQALRDSHLRKYLALSTLRSETPIDLLIWPESATPFLLERDAARRRKIISNLAPGQTLISGTPRISIGEDGRKRLYNGAAVIDWQGRQLADYNKAHLVPFGEYLPFRTLLARVGLDKLAVGSIDYSAGEGGKVIAAAGLPSFRPLICYEILFARELATAGRADWLLNLTNDAWFGLGAGPEQHLQISRARAVEQGLPLVRAANTGISAIIDAYGRTDARLELGQSGVIDGRLPANRPLTLFARTGAFPFWGLVCFFLIFASLNKLRHIYGLRQ